MPNKKIHAVIGVTAEGGAAALVANRNKEEPLAFVLQTVGGLVGGYHGGVLPDIFDPAVTPFHRGFGHSVALATAAGATARSRGAAAITWTRERIRELEAQVQIESDPWRRFLLGVAIVIGHLALGYGVGVVAGYASHVAVDALTPRSLPLLVNGF